MNSNDFMRNQQLNKLRGAAMDSDPIPSGLSRRIDPASLHFSDKQEDDYDEEKISSDKEYDEIDDEAEDNYTEETPEDEDN
ncbi:MAG: hypothetical protein PHQ89_01755 [Bacilli bacterium]|nr:hypothetical protein [Bacilli bacterium]